MYKLLAILLVLTSVESRASFCSILSLPDKSHVIYGSCKELNAGQLESLRSSYTTQLKKNEVYPYNHIDSVGGVWSPTPSKVVNNSWLEFQFNGAMPTSSTYIGRINTIKERSAQINLNRYRPLELVLAEEMSSPEKSALNIAIANCQLKFGSSCRDKRGELVSTLEPLKNSLLSNDIKVGVSLINRLVVRISSDPKAELSELLYEFLKQHFITSIGHVKGMSFVPSRNLVELKQLGDMNKEQVASISKSNHLKYMKTLLLSSCYRDDFKRPCFLIDGTIDKDRFILLRRMAAYLDDVIELLSWITIKNNSGAMKALNFIDVEELEKIISKYKILFSDFSTGIDISNAKKEIEKYLNRRSAYVSRIYRKVFRLDHNFISKEVGAKRHQEIIINYAELSQRLHGDRNKIRYISEYDPVYVAMYNQSVEDSYYPEVKTTIKKSVEKEIVCLALENEYPKLGLSWHTRQGTKLYNAIMKSNYDSNALIELIGKNNTDSSYSGILKLIKEN